jgi:hypothetical protein
MPCLTAAHGIHVQQCLWDSSYLNRSLDNKEKDYVDTHEKGRGIADHQR